MADHRETLRSRLPSMAVIAIMALSLTLAACGRSQGDDKPPQPGDVAVAVVNGHSVWVSDVKREAVAQGLIGEGEPLDQQSDLFRRVLDEVIDQKLLAAEALKRRIDKDPLAQRRLAAARERILGDMLVEDVVGKAVNENAIRGLYAEQLKLSKQSEELRARQIVVATEADGEAVKKLLTTGASFDALAMERSTDAATRFNGGDLGYFTTDVMPGAYAVALKDSKPGEIVGPFRTDAGFVVVRVEDRRQEAPITLEAARPQIVRFLTYDQVRSLIEDLREKAKVQNLLPKQTDVPGAPREPASASDKALQGAAADRGLAGSAPPPAAAEEPIGPPTVSPTPASGIPPKKAAPAKAAPPKPAPKATELRK